MIQLVLKDDLSYFAVRFDDDIPLELRLIFNLTSSDALLCKRDIKRYMVSDTRGDSTLRVSYQMGLPCLKIA